jgi:hypothetical protein
MPPARDQYTVSITSSSVIGKRGPEGRHVSHSLYKCADFNLTTQPDRYDPGARPAPVLIQTIGREDKQHFGVFA